MILTVCVADKCRNLTYDVSGEYGTYCFAHTSLTHKPRLYTKNDLLLTNESEVSSQTLLFRDDNVTNPTKIVSFNTSEKKVKSPIRLLPTPHPAKKTKTLSKKDIQTIENMECCLCSDMHHMEHKMKCGHLVCDECVEHLRNAECPSCGEVLEGPLMVPEMVEEINKRYVNDMKERELLNI
jgi:hypothetical protein